MKNRLFFYFLLLTLLNFSACLSPDESDLSKVTPMPSETVAVTGTLSPTAAPSPTVTPSPTAIPTEPPVDLTVLTGYTQDASGNVSFHPLAEEVLAAGYASTGLYTTVLSDSVRQSLLLYAGSAFSDCYRRTETSYLISGNTIAQTVKSYYYTEYYYADVTDSNNAIALYFDAVNHGFCCADIFSSSKENALHLAADLLSLLTNGQEDGLPDLLAFSETPLPEDGLEAGIFLIFEETHEEYSCISIY